MFILRKILREVKTRYLQAFANKRIPVSMERPIISITFDDVPRSAMTNGVPMLERFNIKATFYVSMGLATSSSDEMGKSEDGQGPFLKPEDILELNRCGHDISCHTYSHYMLKEGTAESMVLDAKKNVKEICQLLNIASIDHFSYPFGQINFKAKRLLGKNYKTMRSSQPGINKASTDLYLLKAISLYSDTFDKESINRTIEETERSRGWLIFYTHGVTERPDAYSCTPDQFEWLLKRCKSSKTDILPVSKAYASLLSSR